jgi:hypothetical protein
MSAGVIGRWAFVGDANNKIATVTRFIGEIFINRKYLIG